MAKAIYLCTNSAHLTLLEVSYWNSYQHDVGQNRSIAFDLRFRFALGAVAQLCLLPPVPYFLEAMNV